MFRTDVERNILAMSRNRFGLIKSTFFSKSSCLDYFVENCCSFVTTVKRIVLWLVRVASGSLSKNDIDAAIVTQNCEFKQT